MFSEAGAVTTNNGTWNGFSTSFYAVSRGLFTNNGTMSAAPAYASRSTGGLGTFINVGTFTQNAFLGALSLAEGGGLIENRGTWTGGFQVRQAGSRLLNSGTINGEWIISSGGTGTNTATGILNGFASNEFGGSLTNAGSITGLVTNQGTLNTTGTLGGGLSNRSSGGVNAAGAVNGAIVNQGALNVTGNLTSNGALTNADSGVVTVNAGAAWTGLTGVSNNNDSVLRVQGSLSTNGTIALANSSDLVVFNGGTVAANSISATTYTTINVDAGGTVNGATNLAGTAFNSGVYNGDVSIDDTSAGAHYAWASNRSGGVWNGDVLSNTGSGYAWNAGIWNGDINSSAYTANFSGGTWVGDAVNNASGNFSNDGTWTGALTNAGFAINLGSISGLVTNSGTLTTDGVLNGGLTNSGDARVAGAVNGAINTSGQLLINRNTTSNGNLAITAGNVQVWSGAAWSGLTGIQLSSTAVDGLLVEGDLSTAGVIGVLADARLRVAAGGVLTAGTLTNAASGNVRVDEGGTLNDDLFNSGVVSNAGAFNANVENTTATAALTNEATGVWTGDLLVNSGGASVANAGTWNGAASNAAVLNNTGTWTGALTNQTTGVATNQGTWNGTVGNAGQFTNASGGSVSGLLTNTGIATNAGTLNGGATITAGSLTTTGTVNGTLTNSAAVLASGAVNGPVSNSGLFQVDGPLTSTGTSFTNLGGGTLLNAASTYTGLGALSNAAGGQIVIGNGTSNGLTSAASLANSGALLMANNRVGDRLTLSGAYTASGGASMSVDLNMASNANLADRLTVGSSSGTTTVTLNNVGGSRSYFTSPIVIVSGGNGQNFVLANNASTNAAMATNGIIDYSARALTGGGWGIVSSLNGGLVSTVTGDSIGFLTAGGANLKPSDDDLRAGDVDALQGAGQVWGRFESSSLDTTNSVTSSDPFANTGPVSADLESDGYKIGGAVRVFASDGLDVDLGVSAGVVNGESRQKASGVVTRFEMPTYGVYAVASFDDLQIDLQYDVLDLNVEASKAVSAKDLSGEGSAVRFGLSLPLKIEGGTATPYVRAESITMEFGETPVPGGIGVLAFGDIDASILQAGVRTQMAFAFGDWSFTPGVDVSLGKEEGDATTLFTPTGSANAIRFDTPRDSTFFDIELGGSMRFVPSGLEFYATLNSRSGDGGSGQGGTVGARMRF
jgi:fibronectin-binding autotransporter adhesin